MNYKIHLQIIKCYRYNKNNFKDIVYKIHAVQ